MALSQIAFDFGDTPQKPLPEKKTIVKKKEKPIVEVSFEIPKQKSTRGRKSLKEAGENVDMIEIPEDEILFQKMYYPIGQVAEMFHVNQSLIRLWENEFDALKPKKNGKGNRLFRPEDIKTLQLIHHLLRVKKYTMEGAKEFIKNNQKADQKYLIIEGLKKLKGFLNELKANL